MSAPEAMAHRAVTDHPVRSPSAPSLGPSRWERPVRIPSGSLELDADFTSPAPGYGIVIFAHGSGSGRRSPRNRQVAHALQDQGLGTLLLDLLVRAEVHTDEITGEYRFNIPLLTGRLVAATDWLLAQPEARDLPIGYFGASTGGAVAMWAAARRPEVVWAIVLRGARSDLGDAAAAEIRCPTLLIVGGRDTGIRALNERTLRLLSCPKNLVVVPGASHLFEEQGALESVANHAIVWFARYLVPQNSGEPRKRSTRV
jgi:putative phosphoribosyl transferase